ncbi:MAG: hypothetical protein ACKO04_09715 [Actinomycetes bacterium]
MTTATAAPHGHEPGTGAAHGRAVRRAAVLVASCVGASFVVWLPSLFAGFTGDDLEGILRASADGRRFPGLDYAAVQWRPLSNLSLRFDRTVWGLDASGFHLTNVVLHGVAAALVAVLAGRLWRTAVKAGGAGTEAELDGRVPPWAPGGLAAALFLVLPSPSEAVAWVGGRGDLLVAVAALVSLLAWWTASEGGDRPDLRWGAVSVGALAVALLAKETAATWPLVLSALEVARSWSASGDGRWRRAAGAAARPWPAYVLVAVWFGTRWAVIGRPLGSYGSDSLLAGGPVGVARRGASVLVRSLLPGLPAQGWLVAALLVAGLLGTLAVAARRPAVRSVLATWPVAFLPAAMVLCSLPVLGLGTSASGALGERLGYLASTFGCVLVAWLLCALVVHRAAVGWTAVGLVLAAALVLCVVAQARWVAAGSLADRLFESAGQLPRDRPALVLNVPDERDGTYVALNALPAALALRHGWTDLTAVWTASTYTQGADGRTSVVDGPGPRTWTVRLRGPGARFLQTYDRPAGAQRAAVRVTLRTPRTARVERGPAPPGAPPESVWAVADGRLVRRK